MNRRHENEGDKLIQQHKNMLEFTTVFYTFGVQVALSWVHINYTRGHRLLNVIMIPTHLLQVNLSINCYGVFQLATRTSSPRPAWAPRTGPSPRPSSSTQRATSDSVPTTSGTYCTSTSTPNFDHSTSSLASSVWLNSLDLREKPLEVFEFFS